MTSVSRYVTSASRYQRRPWMYIQGLILWNSTELSKSILIDHFDKEVRMHLCSMTLFCDVNYHNLHQKPTSFYKIYRDRVLHVVGECCISVTFNIYSLKTASPTLAKNEIKVDVLQVEYLLFAKVKQSKGENSLRF